MKLIVWNSKALQFIRDLDDKTRKEIGEILLLLQQGHKLGEPQTKPMKIIEKNAYEIRVKDRIGNHRVDANDP